MRGIRGTIYLAIIAVSANSLAVTDFDKKAKKLLSDKLLALSRSLDYKAKSRKETLGGGGGQEYNRNSTDTSYLSNITNHYNVWDQCTRWAGPTNCIAYRLRYITAHKDADSSPAEQVMAAAAEQYGEGGRLQQTGNGKATVSVFELQGRGTGPMQKADGRLDTENIADMRLREDIQEKLRKVGKDSTEKNINEEYEGSKFNDPNSLRAAAGLLSVQFEANLAKNLVEQRAAKKGIEVNRNEQLYDSSEYAKKVRQDGKERSFQEKTNEQAPLDFQTITNRLEKRVQLADQITQLSPYAVNPEVQGGRIVSGQANRTPVDEAKTQMNLAAVQAVGARVTDLPAASGVIVREKDLKVAYTTYKAGGDRDGEKYQTNEQTMEGYRTALESAAQGAEAVRAVAPWIRDDSERIRSFKKTGTPRLAQWNGVRSTEIGKDTEYAQIVNNNPPETAAVEPGKLTITRR